MLQKDDRCDTLSSENLRQKQGRRSAASPADHRRGTTKPGRPPTEELCVKAEEAVLSPDFAAGACDAISLSGAVPPNRLTSDEITLILDVFTPAYERMMHLATAAKVSRIPHLREVPAESPQVRREVLIVDDSKFARECLQSSLYEHHINSKFAWNVESLVAQLNRTSVGLILLNANSIDSDTLLQLAIGQDQLVRVIAFGFADEQPAKIASYVDAGVAGIHLNSESLNHLLWIIDEHAKSDTVVCSPTVSAILMKNAFTFRRKTQPAKQITLLSPREKQILELLEGGLSNQQIASKLSVTVHTVKNHVHKVLTKLEVSTRAEAVAYSRAKMFNVL